MGRTAASGGADQGERPVGRCSVGAVRSGEDLKAGDRLGRYQLVRELGRGSMGMVFLAEDTMLRQPVCVKVLHASLADQPEASERFNREIVLARRISHKGVCRLHDIYADGDLRYITMEYVEGESLRDVLQTERPLLSVERVLALGASICEALAAAHDVGVVHRDLKPRNIMVRPNDEASILDFGIATALDGVSSLTIPGIALGTKHYIAPEVWAGRPATPQSDQFAVGVILFNCLTRRMPYNPSREMMLFDSMTKGPPPPPSAVRADVPPAVDAVVLRALAFKPEDRYPGVRSLGAALLTARDQGSKPASAGAVSPAPWTIGGGPDAVTGSSLPPTQPIIQLPDSLTSTDSGDGPPVSAFDATLVTLPPVPPVTTSGPSIRGFVPSNPEGLPVSDASWVVSGRAVDLPAKPRKVEGAPNVVVRDIADMMEPDGLRRGRRRTGLWAAAIVLGAASLAGAIVVLGMPSLSANTDVGEAPTDATGPRARLVVPVVEPTPPIVVDVADAGAASATEVAEVAPDENAGSDAAAATDEQTRRRPKPAVDRDRRRYGDAARALAAAMGKRGILAGDDEELDRLRTRASHEAQQRDYDAALDSVSEATSRASAVVVDRGFVERKLARFNGAFDRVADEKRRAAADARVAKVMSALAEKRYQDANDVLNGAFELLR